MALTACPECDESVSDRATECPSCGCPLETGSSLSGLLLVATVSLILFGVLWFVSAGSVALGAALLIVGIVGGGAVVAGKLVEGAPSLVRKASDWARSHASWTAGVLLAFVGAGAVRVMPDDDTKPVAQEQAAPEEVPERTLPAAPTPTPTATPKTAAVVVAVGTLLSEYKDNEVRADASYKDKLIETTGKVGDVKKDVLGDIYVTVGATGAALEIPQVQCFFDDAHAKKAAQLNKGDTVTVRGRVDGLLMNVIVKECEFVE